MSYPNVFKATAMEEGQDPKFSISLIIPKSDTRTIEKIKKAIELAMEQGKGLLEKNGKRLPKIKYPLKDGDEEKPDDEAYKNSYYLSARSQRRPDIVDESGQPIMQESEFYAGCYGRASVNFYAYNYNKVSPGVGCGLGNLQKLKDGEPLAGGSSAEEDFAEPFEGGDDDLLD